MEFSVSNFECIISIFPLLYSNFCNSPLIAALQTTPAVQPKQKPADDSGSVTGCSEGNNPDRFCSMCQASFNNPLMAQQHYVGKKHRKQMTKMKLMETYGPSTTPGQTAQSSAHQKKRLLLNLSEKSYSFLIFHVWTASTLKGYPCTICKIELNSVEQYQSHISGAKHNNQ